MCAAAKALKITVLEKVSPTALLSVVSKAIEKHYKFRA